MANLDEGIVLEVMIRKEWFRSLSIQLLMVRVEAGSATVRVQVDRQSVGVKLRDEFGILVS